MYNSNASNLSRLIWPEHKVLTGPLYSTHMYRDAEAAHVGVTGRAAQTVFS